MKILYQDDKIIVCVKPAQVLSTDEPGGLPDLLREHLGDPDANIRTVHRLDRVVSGLMVVARTARAASDLSRQIRQDEFGKEYLAVIHGNDLPPEGQFRDLLLRNKSERKTYIVQEPGKDVQEALLEYKVLNRTDSLSRVQIRLLTGRTHQIRAQFSGRGYPLVGDRKYSLLDDDCPIALWSYALSFAHPATGEKMTFTLQPPDIYPWTDC